MKPFFKTKNGVLYCGDCLEILPNMPNVDMILTDPPYSSGGQFRSDRVLKASTKYVRSDSNETCRSDFSGDNKDQRSFLLWSILWLSMAFRTTKSGGTCLVFTDWRQLPTMSDAIQCGNWIWRNIVTWWKPGIRMQRGRFSSSSEYVLYASKGIPIPGEKSPQNVLSYRPVQGKHKSHIAEKPVDLIDVLLGVSPEGGLVLDPFMGSGSTAIACEHAGRKWIGIESMQSNCEIAAKRIKDAVS